MDTTTTTPPATEPQTAAPQQPQPTQVEQTSGGSSTTKIIIIAVVTLIMVAVSGAVFVRRPDLPQGPVESTDAVVVPENNSPVENIPAAKADDPANAQKNQVEAEAKKRRRPSLSGSSLPSKPPFPFTLPKGPLSALLAKSADSF